MVKDAMLSQDSTQRTILITEISELSALMVLVIIQMGQTSNCILPFYIVCKQYTTKKCIQEYVK